MKKSHKKMSIPELVKKVYKQAGVLPKSGQEQLKDIAKKLQ